MDSSHRIVVRGNSLIINEMYFCIDGIRFVDVVAQDYPLVRQLLLVSAGFCLLLGLPLLAYPEYGGPLLFIGIMEGITALSVKRRYALRVGEQMGTSKVVISTDKEELERLRRQIREALENRTEE